MSLPGLARASSGSLTSCRGAVPDKPRTANWPGSKSGSSHLSGTTRRTMSPGETSILWATIALSWSVGPLIVASQGVVRMRLQLSLQLLKASNP